MAHLISSQLILAKQLVNEGKHVEALQVLKDVKDKEDHTLHDKLTCNLINCYIKHQQGLYEEVIKRTEQIITESLRLEGIYLSIDSLLLMTESLLRLFKWEKALERIKQVEELLKSLSQEPGVEYKQREASILFYKGWVHWMKGEIDVALELEYHSLALREELGDLMNIAYTRLFIAWLIGLHKGEINQALKDGERALVLAKESGNKYYIALGHNILAALHCFIGDIDHGKLLYEESLVIFKEFNNKERMAVLFNNISEIYIKKGDFDSALKYLEESIALSYDLSDTKVISFPYDKMIQILVEKGDIELAKQFLDKFEELSKKLNDPETNHFYLFNKALILKKSSRAINRGKAEEIFKQLLDEAGENVQFVVDVLLNLCELLLTELGMTNDIEVLDEINPLITKLLNIAEKSNSYTILCETYLLQAKLSLLTFDIKKTKRYLTQAQQIAERFGLTHLSEKISEENDDLIKKLDLWERLKETGSSMAERINLAQLNQQIAGLGKISSEIAIQVTEDDVEIHKEKKMCLVCRGEVLGFSFLCKCGAIYCENCARAIIDLENVCWACNIPIDYLKPIKIGEEEKRIEDVEK
ncbi:MAG: tetratricopeptide repeat protein [Promethearchaeota archaeon]|jgi:tetratricopeptide (TPR) repeat protein